MPKLTDTQSIILSRAATRPGNLALPLPDGLHGAAAQKVVGMMIARGWLEEVAAGLRRGEPLWRETGDGHGTTLIATEVGLEAIGIEPVVARTIANLGKAKPNPSTKAAPAETGCADAHRPVGSRSGTKQAQIIALLQRSEGAAVAEIVAETGWLAHSVRGMISGALKKKLGLAVTSEKVEHRGRVYRIER